MLQGIHMVLIAVIDLPLLFVVVMGFLGDVCF
ncbi:hypothetical protein AI2614V1_5845 (plasmid) [Klebsiella oxytoca]|nr:hypothetical protein AI2614V1_5845 [Klebsiella oxytoca]CAH3945330.1 hypothetical protein AI2614V1_5845 [Klebsiella oxytoca]